MSRAAAGTLIAALIALQIVLAVASMRGDSATDDEPAHIAAGYLKVTQGDLSFYRYNPPLADSLFALPLLRTRIQLPANWRTAPNPWQVGRALLFETGNDADHVLFLARLATLVTFVALSLACAFAACIVTRNAAAGVIAFALTAFCPNLIAHGRLATNDIASSLFLFAAALLLLWWVERPTLARLLVASIAVAAALLTKVSALIIVPWFALVLLICVARFASRRAERLAGSVALAVLVAIEMTAFYLVEMRGWWVAATYPTVSRLTIPFREYLATFAVIRQFSASGFQKAQYLFGDFSPNGWRHYYLVAFLLKTTIPALLLFLIAIVIAFRQRRQLPSALLALAAFIALYFAAAITSSLALGLRYILPVYPFLYTSIAVLIVLAVRSAANAREQRAMVAAVTLLLAWHVGEAVATYPNYIGYFNELIGSRDNADRFLIDSNLDWGQDLKRLANWVEAEHISRINIDYFGGADVRYYLGNRAVLLDGPDPRRRQPGYYAVSKHFYRVSAWYRQYGLDYEQYFAGAEKVATINGSIDVWRIR